jgi:CDP-2,3-bis-(O-geranylgeranyl)-sn-glycerol synthase
LSDPDPLACAAFLVAAFSLAGVAQTLWLKSPLSRRFAVPIDGGRRFRGRRLFGENKTLRGFVVMVPATGAAFFALAGLLAGGTAGPGGPWELSPAAYGLVGVCAGLGFMAGELPNSFLKRQLGIPPGAAAFGPVARPLFFMLDRLDSIAGMLLVLGLLVATPWQTWLYLALVGPGIHWFFSLVLFALGVKARPA